jgi:hypothetical protein
VEARRHGRAVAPRRAPPAHAAGDQGSSRKARSSTTA